MKLKTIYFISLVLFLLNCSQKPVLEDEILSFLLLNSKKESDSKKETEPKKEIIQGKFFLSSVRSFLQTKDGKFLVVGKNSTGELGLGDKNNRTTLTELKDDRIAGKIKDIHSDDFSVYIETTDGKLFVSGGNFDGRLGLGDRDNRITYVELKDSSITGKIKNFIPHGGFNFIETTDSKLFVFGDNRYGQLGLGDSAGVVVSSPTELKDDRITGKIKKITSTSSYSRHFSTFIETTDGKLFVFGSNQDGELGLGDTNVRKSPVELDDSRIKGKIKNIINNGSFNYIETTDGKLFVFGNNEYGQLGLGDKNNRKSPVELDDSRIKGKIKNIISNSFSSTYIETTDNKLFVFGLLKELGLGDSNGHITTPLEFTDPRIAGKVKNIWHRTFSTFIETTDGRLWAAGYNLRGQLGSIIEKNKRTRSFMEITNPKISRKVKSVVTDSSATFIATTDNKIFVSGANSYGQLGLGDTKNRTSFVESFTQIKD